MLPCVRALGELTGNGDSQEQTSPLLQHNSVSVAPVAANEKGASWSTGRLGVFELSLGMPPDLIKCENTNLSCT